MRDIKVVGSVSQRLARQARAPVLPVPAAS